MKHISIEQIIKTVCSMLAVFIFQHAAAKDETELKLSNCKSNIVTYLRVSSSLSSAGAALYYPEATMSAYAGNEITSLNIGTVGSTSTDGLTIFITKDLDGTPEYEQKCTASKSGWNSIELTTPYTITGEALYIGYEITGFIYICACEAFLSGEEWTKTTTDGWLKYDGKYSSAIEAIVEGDDLPRNSIYLEDIKMPEYTTTNSPMTYSGTFINLGASPVESLTLSYYTDSVLAYSEAVEVDSTGYRSTGSFTSGGFSLAEEGNPAVYVEISKVNNDEDRDMSDNISRTKNVLCRDAFTTRNVLAEVFSTELCVNCAAAHTVIEEAFADYDNIIEVGHHSGYYTDTYTVSESTDFEWFYGTMVYAPAVMLDRTRFDNYDGDYSYTGTPITAPSEDDLPNLCSEAVAAPAFVSVDLTSEYDADTRFLALTVSGEHLLPTDDYSDLRLNVFILEDSIFTTNQKNTNGSFYHRYSLRSSLTGSWGEAIDVSSGYYNIYLVEIADTIDAGQVYAVAFVSNYDADDRLNCHVLNASRVKIYDGEDESTGISSLKTSDKPLAVVSDGTIIAGQGARRIAIYDMSGRCLVNTAVSDAGGGRVISISHLPQGTYIMRAFGESSNESAKIIKH